MPRSWDDDECGEWFEIYNATDHEVDIAGWSYEDPGSGLAGTVPSNGLLLEVGAAVVVGAPSDWRCTNYSAVTYGTWNFSLGFHEGGIVLRDSEGRVRDAVVWDASWGFDLGRSLELVDPSLDNALRANWAPATETYGWDDYPLYGTPRRVPEVGQGAGTDACDDGNSCTVDYGDDEVGCVHFPADVRCDDGDECTADDRCTPWYDTVMCVGGAPLDCDDGDPCTGDWCESGAEGGCRHVNLAYCSGELPCDPVWGDCPERAAGSPCFGYVCSEEGRCELVYTSNPCDDGERCTVRDHCDLGRCHGGAPERYPSCGTDLHFISEGICVPDLGGVFYPIWAWWDEVAQHWNDFVTCGDCPHIPNDSPCGPAVCWELTNQCGILLLQEWPIAETPL